MKKLSISEKFLLISLNGREVINTGKYKFIERCTVAAQVLDIVHNRSVKDRTDEDYLTAEFYYLFSKVFPNQEAISLQSLKEINSLNSKSTYTFF